MTKRQNASIDANLLERLRLVAFTKHKTLHGSIKTELENAIKEYLLKEEKKLKKMHPEKEQVKASIPDFKHKALQ